jgi:heat shock protein HslJ
MMTIHNYSTQKPKNCQTKPFQMGILAIASVAVFLSACSTSPKPAAQSEKKQVAVASSPSLPTQPTATGLTNVYWDIEVINGNTAKSFTNKPALFFWGSNGQVSGSTGCNALYGKYREGSSQLLINAWAGHMNCGGALAQEADLMDNLARITGYQLNQNILQLHDANQKVLIRARRR